MTLFIMYYKEFTLWHVCISWSVKRLTRLNFLPPLLAVSLPFWIQAFLNMVKHRDVSPKWQLHSIKFSLEVKSSGVGSNFHGKKVYLPQLWRVVTNSVITAGLTGRNMRPWLRWKEECHSVSCGCKWLSLKDSTVTFMLCGKQKL